jgi:hypothetical protein
MSRTISQPMSLTNSRRTLKTIAYLKKSLSDRENDIYRLLLGRNQGLWRHFGVRVFQGNVTLCKARDCGHIGGDILSLP